jgi:molecular chaperone Hsp33
VINESQLYTFIDSDKKFALYFLEGQKLIHDLVLTQNLKQKEFDYFRSSILSVQLMLGLLKTGELFCVYIDSEIPYFRLKIEINAMGLMRGMIYSDALDTPPDTITGKLRLLKFLPSSKMPYQSVIALDNVGMNEIVNLVLSRSYQVNSRIFVSMDSDQSFMLNQLPLTKKEQSTDMDQTFDHYAGPLTELMKKGLTDKAALIGEISNLGFKFLAEKQVEFKCGCSKDQMIQNIKRFAASSNEAVFLPGQDTIEVVCEYCKAAYPITRKEIESSPSTYQ